MLSRAQLEVVGRDLCNFQITGPERGKGSPSKESLQMAARNALLMTRHEYVCIKGCYLPRNVLHSLVTVNLAPPARVIADCPLMVYSRKSS
ncbi:hypothetical protein BDR06DRAFT_58297 [Suillus hirtellus]|nr:hypothetical protein BDR06DRAFT_58297 [Suillus hirtellus]